MDISGFPMPNVNAIGTVWNFYFKDKVTSDKVIPGFVAQDILGMTLPSNLRKFKARTFWPSSLFFSPCSQDALNSDLIQHHSYLTTGVPSSHYERVM